MVKYFRIHVVIVPFPLVLFVTIVSVAPDSTP